MAYLPIAYQEQKLLDRYLCRFTITPLEEWKGKRTLVSVHCHRCGTDKINMVKSLSQKDKPALPCYHLYKKK